MLDFRSGLWRKTSLANKNRMSLIPALEGFAAQLREFMRQCACEPAPATETAAFNPLALHLFALHFQHNPVYRSFCQAQSVSPQTVHNWTDIPALPTAAFKEFEPTCLPPQQRTTIFHSSCTTAQRPSRNFHNADSLRIYQESLWPWFAAHLGPFDSDTGVLILTPSPTQAPHSSLVHMFETIRRGVRAPEDAYAAQAVNGDAWTLWPERALERLRRSADNSQAFLLLGTAFMFVHLLDFLTEHRISFQLAPGSRLLETGGYKGRSRSLPKNELHQLLKARLGIPPEHIICEYGMSELASQAYDRSVATRCPASLKNDPSKCAPEPPAAGERTPLLWERGWGEGDFCGPAHGEGRCPSRCFHFPPWCRVQVISPETGREVAENQTGLLRMFDLANVASVLAIQTEDLAIRRGTGFGLLGRAALAEPRGCSLMAV